MGDLIELFGGSSSTDDQNVASNLLQPSATASNESTFEATTSGQYLPPEPQVGNVEYKLMLNTNNAQRLQHLTTQMNWRLKEGQGIAFYEIGVGDDGQVIGLDDRQLQKSLHTLQKMAEQLDATVSVIRERKIVSNCSKDTRNFKMACQVMISRKVNRKCQTELRVAVLGDLLLFF